VLMNKNCERWTTGLPTVGAPISDGGLVGRSFSVESSPSSTFNMDLSGIEVRCPVAIGDNTWVPQRLDFNLSLLDGYWGSNASVSLLNGVCEELGSCVDS
jgi:hypothetical protein